MARPTWKGTLSFGLVNIGVDLHTMETSERLDFDMLDQRDMGRIGYQKINKTTGKAVESKDIVKGYAVSKNKYVLLTDADIKSANPKASRTVDVIGFVDQGAIGRIYYSRPYLVAPNDASAKAYRLLYEVLEETGQLALARIVLHTKEHTAVLFPQDDALILQLLRFDQDLRSAKDFEIELPKKGAAKPAEVQMAEKLVETMQTTWDPSDYKDTYRDDLMKLIKARAKKGAKESEEPPKQDKDETPVLDLMAALKRSLGEEKGASKSGRAAPPTKRLQRPAAKRAKAS